MIGAVESPPLNDNAGEASCERPEAEAQRVFVRMITARPGAPWDQSRQAALEARLGAPARSSEIVWRVRRLDAWRPGAEARFAAVYARSEDAKAGLTATPIVDGRRVSVSFAPAVQQARRLSGLVLAGLASAAIVVCILALGGQVIARRGQLTGALDTVEQASIARLRQAQDLSRLKRQARALDEERLNGRQIGDLLADLTWASMAKSPSAHIQALHWDHGYMAVESQGDAAPFGATDRPVQRSQAPVRPGVWLWGVSTLEPWEAKAPAQRTRRRP